MSEEERNAARERMVEEQIRARGIEDEEILAALGRVPRHRFVREKLQELAYGDFPLPIEEEQTISQPYIVALMTRALGPLKGRRVLELGTGSGYQTAMLLELGATVVSIERHESLAKAAEERLTELGYEGFTIHAGDGTLGWPEGAPWDAIIATAAAPEAIPELHRQLALEGVLVIPIGDRRDQRLMRIRRQGDAFVEEDLGGVVFLPLVGERGFERP